MNECSNNKTKQPLSQSIKQVSPCLFSKEKKSVVQWWEEGPKPQMTWLLAPGQHGTGSHQNQYGTRIPSDSEDHAVLPWGSQGLIVAFLTALAQQRENSETQ